MKVSFLNLARQNARYMRKQIFKPRLRGLFIWLICFYQRRLSRHTCLYTPTCSEYTKRCINNWGCFIGILLGVWRILRCNPLSKGGYDPAPELFWKKKWLL